MMNFHFLRERDNLSLPTGPGAVLIKEVISGEDNMIFQEDIQGEKDLTEAIRTDLDNDLCCREVSGGGKDSFYRPYCTTHYV